MGNDRREGAEKRRWHELEAEKVLEMLKTREDGLDGEEAGRRLAEWGPNRLTPQKKRGALRRFLAQFRDVLIYVLLIAAAVTLAIGHLLDAGVILGVVLINALIGYLQEGKAEKALEAIGGMLSHRSIVMRDSKKTGVAAEELVPGDVVLLQSGDRVPADMRLFRVRDLRVDESALTGESVPVEKDTRPAPGGATVGDRTSMAFSGTLVTYGQASGVVVATGDATEIGRISELLASVEPLTTPLLVQMAQFGRWLTAAIIAMASVTVLFGVFVRGNPAVEMFLAGVGLSVAAIPEGLPAIITITLAIGVERMARRNAIIRRLPAVETLGSVTVICTDKTGTLTRNEMTVQKAVTADGSFSVSGEGYEPRGSFYAGGAEVNPAEHPVLTELARAALLANDASISEAGGRWQVHGDPTDGALLVFGYKAGLTQELEGERFPRLDTIPFESEHRFMATLHHNHSAHRFVYLKGAPEKVIEMCSRQREAGQDRMLDKNLWHERISEAANNGLRLIAVAFKAVGAQKDSLGFKDAEGGFSLLGVLGMIDPPGQEAVRAVGLCRSAGIKVKMITGDHALTAAAIGAQTGIGEDGRVMTGREIEATDDERLRAATAAADIFARVSPEHKLRLVKALQAGGEVTAMTGDGVNDAPALKRADVGIAMGIRGTEVSKEAAEMVLADDNFASIAHAVEEGRTVYDNIKKAVIFILPTNGGEAGTIIAAVASGSVLPITPVQILWVNMVTAVTLALSLAFEPPETEVMKRPPRRPGEPILSGFLLWRIIFVSMVIVAGTFGLFLYDIARAVPIEEARSAAVNMIIAFEAFYLINCRYLKASVISFKGIFGNRYALAAIAIIAVIQGFFTYEPHMQALFGVAPLGALDWARIILAGTVAFFLVEFEKFWVQRGGKH